MSITTIESIHRLLESHEDFGFSGSAVVIGPDGTAFVEGYGLANHRLNVPCTPTTLFDIGSVSKQFTAAGILLLVQRGLLGLHDTLSDHLPSTPPDKADISIAQLLVHRSAVIRNHADSDYVEMSMDEAVERILSAPLRRQPGDAFEYSNSGYTLLAAVIQQASRKDFMAFMHDEIFAPAAMPRTGFYGEQPVEEYARGYDGYSGTLDHGSPGDWVGPSYAVVGNGAVVSCAQDLAAWEVALRSNLIFDENTRSMLEQPHTEEYGYGWRVRVSEPLGRIVRHSGANEVFNCEYVRLLDKQTTVVLLTNRSVEECMLLPPVMTRLLQLLSDEPVAAPPPRIASRQSPGPLLGDWQADGGSISFEDIAGRAHLSAVGLSLLGSLTGSDPSVIKAIATLLQAAGTCEIVVREDYTSDDPYSDFFFDEPDESGSTKPEMVAHVVAKHASHVFGHSEAIDGFEHKGTARVGKFDIHDVYVSYLTLVSQSGAVRPLRLLWFDGANLAGALSGSRQPLGWVVNPVSDSNFVSYDPMTGTEIQLSLTNGTLSIQAPDSTIVAQRPADGGG